MGPGDRVMLLLPPDLADRFAIAYVAAHKAGAVVVPVNPRYAPRESLEVASRCFSRWTGLPGSTQSASA